MEIEADIQGVLNQAFDLFKNQYVALIIATIIAAIGSLLVITAPPLVFGLYYMALKVARGEKTEINDVFKGFDYFVTSWVMTIVAVIAILIGLLFLVLPGLFLMVVFQYAVVVALTEKRGAIDSLARSYELGKENLSFSLVFFVIAAIINGIGSVIPLGGLVTLPYTVLATCIATQKLTQKTKK